MPKTKPDAGAQYRLAKDELVLAVRAEIVAELAMISDRECQGWWRIPESARPVEPAGVQSWRGAVEHTRWCRALVVACGEAVKGKPFEECI